VLFGNGARVEGGMAFSREGVGVEGDERVFGAVLLERVVEGEQAGEVGGVGYKGRPYCGESESSDVEWDESVPFFDFTPADSVVRLVVSAISCLLLSDQCKVSKSMRHVK
jgi:hypothetical protein